MPQRLELSGKAVRSSVALAGADTRRRRREIAEGLAGLSPDQRFARLVDQYRRGELSSHMMRGAEYARIQAAAAEDAIPF